METDLISLMFTQFNANLASFISNDISVALLAMLSLLFTVFAFGKIREIFNISMTKGDIEAQEESLGEEECQMSSRNANRYENSIKEDRF